MISPTNYLTLEEFLELPETDSPCELFNGQAIPKVSPKFFHSAVQKTLLLILDSWAKNKGRVYQEWSIKLKRNGSDWVPIPDLCYISYERLSANWILDEACPVAPELTIEIISPGQTFGDLVEKASAYLIAGVNRVWLVDTKAQTITIFYPQAVPTTFRANALITDELLPQLELTPQQIFQQSGLSNRENI